MTFTFSKGEAAILNLKEQLDAAIDKVAAEQWRHRVKDPEGRLVLHAAAAFRVMMDSAEVEPLLIAILNEIRASNGGPPVPAPPR